MKIAVRIDRKMLYSRSLLLLDGVTVLLEGRELQMDAIRICIGVDLFDYPLHSSKHHLGPSISEIPSKGYQQMVAVVVGDPHLPQMVYQLNGLFLSSTGYTTGISPLDSVLVVFPLVIKSLGRFVVVVQYVGKYTTIAITTTVIAVLIPPKL